MLTYTGIYTTIIPDLFIVITVFPDYKMTTYKFITRLSIVRVIAFILIY